MLTVERHRLLGKMLKKMHRDILDMRKVLPTRKAKTRGEKLSWVLVSLRASLEAELAKKDPHNATRTYFGPDVDVW